MILGIADLPFGSRTDSYSSWPHILKRPLKDAAFALPSQVLLKLKPARDAAYLKRSIPDLAQFRLGYMLIKAWAKSNGIYAAKFGFLGGIHIASMLVPICKALRLSHSSISVPDVITTFFDYYSGLDWKHQIIFDPFFHESLKYNRTSREAMCLLGWHGPSLNTALAASLSTVRIISQEIQRANYLLSEMGMTWPRFLGTEKIDGSGESVVQGHTNAASFLENFKSYAKIEVHYWGPSLAKGKRFIGWLESRCVQILVGESD